METVWVLMIKSELSVNGPEIVRAYTSERLAQEALNNYKETLDDLKILPYIKLFILESEMFGR